MVIILLVTKNMYYRSLFSLKNTVITVLFCKNYYPIFICIASVFNAFQKLVLFLLTENHCTLLYSTVLRMHIEHLYRLYRMHTFVSYCRPSIITKQYLFRCGHLFQFTQIKTAPHKDTLYNDQGILKMCLDLSPCCLSFSFLNNAIVVIFYEIRFFPNFCIVFLSVKPLK